MVQSLQRKYNHQKYSFESHIDSINTKLPEQTLSINELKEAFFFLKSNKSPGINDMIAKINSSCFGELAAPLKHVFELSLSQGIFSEKLKLAKVTPIFENDEKIDLGNYRPISVLHCLSRILELLMCNCLFKYLTKNNILYD